MFVRGASVLLTLALAGVCVLSTGCNKNAVDAQKMAKEAETISGEDWKGAAEKYKSASQLDPSNHIILAKVAALYEKNAVWQDAADYWAKAAGADPAHGSDDYAKYHFQRGYDLYQLALKDPGHQGFDKAIDPFKKAIEKDQNYADAHYYLGKVYEQQDNEQDAVNEYVLAIQTKADELAYYADLALLTLNNGEGAYGLAVAQQGQAMADKAQFTDKSAADEAQNTWYNLAIDEARGDFLLNKNEEAIAALVKAKALPNPKNSPREVGYYLAEAYYGIKRDKVHACQELATYSKSPAGKAKESVDNHKDADQLQLMWGCSGT